MAFTKLEPTGVNTSASFTFANVTITGILTTSGTLSIGNVSNLEITGGSSGQVLTTDGSGNLTWANGTGGVAGSNTQIQFNNNNILGASANLTFDIGTSTLTATNLAGNASKLTHINGANIDGYVPHASVANTAATVTTNAQPNITSVGTLTSLSVTGNVSGNYFIGNGSQLTGLPSSYANSNVSAYLPTYTGLVGGTLSTSAQPNITSVGTLSGVTATGTANFIGASNVSLGNIEHVHINGGSSGQYLQTDGTGTLQWTSISVGSTSGISNGNSNVDIASSGANITVGVNGQSNVVVISKTNVNVNTDLSVSNNIISGTGTGGSLLGANLVSANLLTGTITTAAQPNITSVGTLTSLSVTGNVSGNYFIGNGSTLTHITGANVDGNVAQAAHAYYSDVANSVVGTNVSGNVSQAVHAYYSDVANLVVGSNVSGNVGNAIHAYYADVANSIVGTNVSGNVAQAVHAYYADTANAVAGVNVSGNVSQAVHSYYADIANSIVGTNVSGNVDNAVHAYYADVANSVTGTNVSGNVNNAVHAYYADVANSVVGTNVSGNVAQAVHAYYADVANSIAGGSITGVVANATYANVAGIAGTVTTNAQPNITSVGTLTDLVISGNLTVSGSTAYTNVNNLYIKDPLIEVGGNSNGTALTSDDGKDRGTLLHYYNAKAVDAFMGWDNSNAEFAFGSNVTASGNVVTFNAFGNIRAGYYVGDGSLLTNLTGSTVTGNVSQAVHSYYSDVANSVTGANVSGNVSQAVHAYYSDVANSVAGANVSGNVSQAVHSYYSDVANSIVGTNVSGNVSQAVHAYYSDVANSVAGANVSGNVNNAVHSYYSDVANSIVGTNVSGNVAQAVHAYYSDVANSVAGANVSGVVATANLASYVTQSTQSNITAVGTLTGLTLAANSNISLSGILSQISGANTVSATYIAGTLTTAAQPTITSVGTLTSLSVTGNVSGNYFIGNGSQLTGLPSSYANSNVAAYLPTYTGNVSANYFIGNGSQLTGLPAGYANSNVAAYLPTYTGNLTAGNANISGTLTVGTFNTTSTGSANITGANYIVANYFIGNGSQLTGLPASYANSNVATYLPTYSGLVGGTLSTAAQPNITSVGTLTSLSVTGLTTSGNVRTTNILDNAGTLTIQTKYSSQSGDIGVTGNIVAGTGGSGNVTATYFIGNGSQLTGLPSSYANSNVAAYLPTYTGNFAAGNISVSGAITDTLGDLTLTSATDSNVVITASGSGRVILDNMKWPNADGTINQVLTTDGSGNLSWATGGGGGGTVSYYTRNYYWQGPVQVNTGSQRVYVTSTTTLTGIYFNLGTVGGTDTVVVTKKNGTSINSTTLTAGTSNVANTTISTAFVLNDYVTVDITTAGASAVDLYVTYKFQTS